MEMAPWLALWPGVFLTIVVYSLNMFGDALRDLLDPRLRGGQGSYGAAKKRKRGLLAQTDQSFLLGGSPSSMRPPKPITKD